MLVMCSILLTINAGIPVITRADVEGKILKESDENYLVDFSKGLSGYNLVGNPKDYSKVLVKKTECVKE